MGRHFPSSRAAPPPRLPHSSPLSLQPTPANARPSGCYSSQSAPCCSNNGAHVSNWAVLAKRELVVFSPHASFLKHKEITAELAVASAADPAQAEGRELQSSGETVDDGVIAKEGVELVGTPVLAPPPQFAPAQGDAVTFIVISIFLLVVFWLGNYLAPDMIFRDTVFRREPVDKPDDSEPHNEV
ncbi:hypothetical protein O6H91_06G119000 [Diphasiastrum complanatum]|uniref:Uncharacterized protein n=1 Tax=Diphasiastrum complanatum TaxID=34168 RepID=A0ACC2DII8_DIPCM|nr:hypothetical protein O6H91_06G119000 [Diphasiastrum complanatum]